MSFTEGGGGGLNFASGKKAPDSRVNTGAVSYMAQSTEGEDRNVHVGVCGWQMWTWIWLLQAGC